MSSNNSAPNDREVIVGVSKAPSDPKENEAWCTTMARLTVAGMISGGKGCAHCGIAYDGVDDFIQRDVRKGYGDDMVDGKCWEAYENTHQK